MLAETHFLTVRGGRGRAVAVPDDLAESLKTPCVEDVMATIPPKSSRRSGSGRVIQEIPGGVSMESERVHTVSAVALTLGIVYSFVLWFFLPVISAKCHGSAFFASGTFRWLIVLFGLPCVAKEFFVRDKRITAALNISYICFLLGLSMWWASGLFAPI
jgi:hypothetical protein